MNIIYDKQVLEDLKVIEPLQARMLLDYFEHKYLVSETVNAQGKVFKTGSWRILFTQSEDTIIVLRIIQ